MTHEPRKPVDWSFDEESDPPEGKVHVPGPTSTATSGARGPARSGLIETAAGTIAAAEPPSAKRLRRALRLPEGQNPFPWQLELLRRFLRGDATEAIDIPTGLGKTAVMAIWLVARACGARLSRRLVYVVDRRAVVDQATEVAEELREWVQREPAIAKALELDGRSLPISTLRGQHVDNKDWLADPAAPAIIVGTVDMIGSRLLFSGYGVSPKMRPYHAGLLGADTLVVLDEAHLVPPFEDLLREIANGHEVFGPRDRALSVLVPTFSLLSLSATGRQTEAGSLTLGAADLTNPVVRERLDASKTLSTLPLATGVKLAGALADQAWELTGQGAEPVRCLVFCNARKDATTVADELRKLAKAANAPEPTVELFVGARRVRERTKARDALARLGFLAGSSVALERAVFLIATSAGEVGVDLDADHMICDLVAWERMVQRLGRVNRRGNGAAKVVVVVEGEPTASDTATKALAKRDVANKAQEEIKVPKERLRKLLDDKENRPKGRKKSIEEKKSEENRKQEEKELKKAIAKHQKRIKDYKDADAKLVAQQERELAHHRALRALLAAIAASGGDLSPGALAALKQRPELSDTLSDATTVDPLRPALTRALVDAWSMTSLDEHPGRPQVEPWLRGWRPNEPPQTSIVWRQHLPVRRQGAFEPKAARRFFEAAPPHASELLETEAYRAIEWLIKRAEGAGATAPAEPVEKPLYDASVIAIALTPRGDVKGWWTLKQLRSANGSDGKKARERLEERVAGTTLVVDARLGGLSSDGLLDEKNAVAAEAADDEATLWLNRVAFPGVSVTGFRIVRLSASEDDEAKGLSRTTPEDQWVRRALFVVDEVDGEPTNALAVDGWAGESATEDDRAEANRPQNLDEHQSWAEDCAKAIASRVGLTGESATLLTLAARLHDEGKKSARWQRAFKAPRDGAVYAKTAGPIDFALLDGYRHELGSLPYVKQDKRFLALTGEAQDLVLHLIATHHGFGRPVIGTSGCDDAPPSVVEARAREVAFRFARQQGRWGPWGLAWWEALLRSADQEASRRNQEQRVSPVANKEQG